MVHNLIFSGLFLAILVALSIFYYRRKMISMRSLLISIGLYMVLTALIFIFIWR